MPAKKASAPKAADRPPSGDAPTTAKKGGKTYKVTAPLISVQVGERVLQFAAGDVLPGGLSQDALDHLNRRGFIAEAD